MNEKEKIMNEIDLEAKHINPDVTSITPLQGKLLGSCLILFCLMIIISIVSLIVSIKRKNKIRILYQIILSIVSLISSYYIVGNSIMLFGMNSDLYMGLTILAIGNILTLINIFKK